MPWSHQTTTIGCYNVQVKWENGEITYEPLDVIAKDDFLSCAVYARDNDLLEVPGWKWFRCLTQCKKHLLHLIKQAKMWSFKYAPQYKFGFCVPNDYREALHLDEEHGTSNGRMRQTLRWSSSRNMSASQTPASMARIHLRKITRRSESGLSLFDVKHDGRHKSRLVAGHLTGVPINSIYSSIVSLRGLQMVTFLSELNDLELWATNIGNPYLEALMVECVYIVAGPAFGELEGHMLIIYKVLYGLCSSRLAKVPPEIFRLSKGNGILAIQPRQNQTSGCDMSMTTMSTLLYMSMT